MESNEFEPGLAKFIDHTLLKPEATQDQVVQLCAEAERFEFASVCVNPCWVSLCAGLLRNSKVKVCAVIGFPLGANLTVVKVFETQKAIEDGAQEIDMVMNIGMLKSGSLDYVEEDIQAVVDLAKSHQVLTKVILETCLLTDEEKTEACLLAKSAGADFVKTSTGFNRIGATTNDVALMRRVVGDSMGVKAAGGVRTREEAEAMIRNGASRIGASASLKIIGAQDSERAASY
jgi:deoxyribose-phosphate aldolase